MPERIRSRSVVSDAVDLPGVVAQLSALRSLGEAVETPGQLAALHGAGCGLFQGHLLGRPVPLHAATSPALLGAGQA